MKEQIKDIQTETDLCQNRLRQVSEAQRALAAQDYNLCTQHIWNIISTVDKDATPRKEMEKALDEVRSHHAEREKVRDRIMKDMRILEGTDFRREHSSMIEMETAQEFYDKIMDILVRWELIK